MCRQRGRQHLLRHAAGTEMAAAGVGIEVIQALLGHRSITSAQVYVHPSQGGVREAVQAMEKVSQTRRARRNKGDCR